MAKQSFSVGQVLTAAQMQSLQQTAMLGGSATAKTASYTLVAADAGTVVSVNSTSATTITVNTGLFSDGDTVTIQNWGSGLVTITAGTATVNTAGSLIVPQYDGGVLYFTSASAAIYFDFVQAGAVSPLTTKGDLYGFGSSDARIPIGANNTVLTADSGETLGLKWATPAGGFNAFLNTKNTNSYVRPMVTGTLGQAGPDVGTTHYVPVFLTGNAFDRISLRTSSGFTTSTATIRLGIYNANTTTGKPSTVYLDAGTVVATASSTIYEITISTTPPAGWYYLALNIQSKGAGDALLSGWSSPGLQISTNIWDSMTVNNNQGSLFQTVSVSGGFATAGTTFIQTDLPNIGLRMV